MTYPITGSCLCGDVIYTLTKPPIVMVACHCKQCQKASTSAFSITAMIDADALEVSGDLKEWRRVAASGTTSAAKFCPTCGGHIYHFNPDNAQHLMLKPSTLNDSSVINPTIHVWVSEKQDWYEIPDGVQAFETQP